jgi:hypothetical protein
MTHLIVLMTIVSPGKFKKKHGPLVVVPGTFGMVGLRNNSTLGYDMAKAYVHNNIRIEWPGSGVTCLSSVHLRRPARPSPRLWPMPWQDSPAGPKAPATARPGRVRSRDSPGTRHQRSVFRVGVCMNSAERAYHMPCSMLAYV